jgi:hypothetical protein
MSAFYASEQAMNEQLAFKRALMVSAHQTVLSLQNQNISPSYLQQVIWSMDCDHSFISSPTYFPDLTSKDRECLSRFEVLRAWARVSADWSAHSDYDANVRCAGPNNSTLLDPQLPLGSSLTWTTCSALLYHDRFTNHVSLQPGLEVFIHSKSLGSNASSELPYLEVGG